MSLYDPKTIVSTQLSTKTDQCFAFLRDGKCRWGASCRFAHGQQSKSNSQGAKKAKDTTQHVIIEKKKKPKHLKRKLQQAHEFHDEEKLRELEKEQQHLEEIKDTSAKHFKKTCKKIVTKIYGEGKFDETKFREYVQAGYSKDKLLKKLGISENEQKQFKANRKKMYSDEQDGFVENHTKKSKINNSSDNNDDNDDNDNSVNDSVRVDERTNHETETKASLKVDKKSCKKLVKKLYGDERWNESLYDELIGQGMRGETLLEALGISKRHVKNFK